MLLSSPPLRLFYVPKALKDPDQVAQSDGEESPAAGEQLLGEVLIFIILDNCMIIVYLTWKYGLFLTTCCQLCLNVFFLRCFKGKSLFILPNKSISAR